MSRKRLKFPQICAIILTTCMMSFLFAGCALPDFIQNNNGRITGNNTNEDTSSSEENLPNADLTYLDNVTYAKICDPAEGLYVEELDISLTDEELDALKAISDEISCKDYTGTISSTGYAIKFYDEKDNEVAMWMVGMRYTIEDSTGQVLNMKDNELQPWLTAIEEKYITSEILYERTPGPNYFYQLDKTVKVNVYELLDTPTVENPGMSVTLTEEEVQALCACQGTISVKEVEEDERDYSYTISGFTEAGADTFEFWIKADGRIYVRNDQGAFEVYGEEIEAWVRQIEDAYGFRVNMEE